MNEFGEGKLDKLSHSSIAAIKYGFNSPTESYNLGGVNFLTIDPGNHATDDKNAGKAKSVAKRTPIPPLEIGSEA